jgi:hypothetical protein
VHLQLAPPQVLSSLVQQTPLPACRTKLAFLVSHHVVFCSLEFKALNFSAKQVQQRHENHHRILSS